MQGMAAVGRFEWVRSFTFWRVARSVPAATTPGDATTTRGGQTGELRLSTRASRPAHHGQPQQILRLWPVTTLKCATYTQIFLQAPWLVIFRKKIWNLTWYSNGIGFVLLRFVNLKSLQRAGILSFIIIIWVPPNNILLDYLKPIRYRKMKRILLLF